MSEPRFIVTEFTGYRISGSDPGYTSRYAVTDYYVQDRLYLYAVVVAYAPLGNGTPHKAVRKRLAEAECDRLNAWWQGELADGLLG